ncbi:cold-shock protein [Erythrobacter sp. W53]|uniref:cold-shock protein n=1 Tax=Erythrobacter sp. W53 TaxID=3425947 RepID=UPI003D769083
MTHYGKIKSYDSSQGAGTITAEQGGDVLSFGKSDLRQQAQEPQVDQRFGYDTKQVDGGKTRAVNLHMNQGTSEKAAKQQA